MNVTEDTLMSDVFQHFVGHNVVLYIEGPLTLKGHLEAYNGLVLHLRHLDGITSTYIPSSRAVAIRNGE